MKTYSALFAGFDLAGRGLEAAGYEPINLFEYDPVLAEVGQANSRGKYVVSDVCDVNWHRYEAPDVLWASPVCKNASVAKAGGEESGIDIATAEATGRAIETWLPETVFIENVWGYRKFKAFGLLCEVLTKCGYWFQVHHLNAADFGVPQTRKRLILRATRNGFLKPLPPKTRWVGWYKAIEDLIPTLPETKFAQWQLDRLPSELMETSLVTGQANTTREATVLSVEKPCATVINNWSHRPSHMAWAFLVDDQTSHGGTQAMVRQGEEPAFTTCTRSGGGTVPRAFILSNAKTEYSDGMRQDTEPALSVTTQHQGRLRAFIANGTPNDCGKSLTTRHDGEPVFTVVSQSGTRQAMRAWLSQGRVVSMTPRALARFQSLPDSFELSGKTSVDCTGIGNGVPCLLVQRLAEAL